MKKLLILMAIFGSSWGVLVLLDRPVDDAFMSALFFSLWGFLFVFIGKKQKDAEKNLRPDEIKAKRQAEYEEFSEQMSKDMDLNDITNIQGHRSLASPFADDDL